MSQKNQSLCSPKAHTTLYTKRFASIESIIKNKSFESILIQGIDKFIPAMKKL